MRGKKKHQNQVVLYIVLGLSISILIAIMTCCEGTIGTSCTDNTKFCAIIKELAPSAVQPALEDCPTSLTICDGEKKKKGRGSRMTN
jgi:hypothetical protein